jgi:diguanylate cyclase (GGDEF)-like protein
MEDLAYYSINGILFVGACLLCISFFPIEHLTAQLPPGRLRKKWNEVRALSLFYIAGYAIFLYLQWMNLDKGLDLIVPAVFFLGSVLILFIGMLALETANEVKRTITLEYESITDHLIGISNRRHLDKKIAEEMARAHRYSLTLSLLLLDIDHFKALNDTHGHHVGDIVLKRLGQLLVKKVRDTDFVARYGGEEIAILCPQTVARMAFDLAERLRREIETSIMSAAEESENRQVITITVSIGVAGYDGQFNDSLILVKRADEALYKAKNDGRNRVVLFQDEHYNPDQVPQEQPRHFDA